MNKNHREVIKRLGKIGVEAKYRKGKNRSSRHGQIYWYYNNEFRYVTVSNTKMRPMIHKKSWGDIAKLLRIDGLL